MFDGHLVASSYPAPPISMLRSKNSFLKISLSVEIISQVHERVFKGSESLSACNIEIRGAGKAPCCMTWDHTERNESPNGQNCELILLAK